MDFPFGTFERASGDDEAVDMVEMSMSDEITSAYKLLQLACPKLQ